MTLLEQCRSAGLTLGALAQKVGVTTGRLSQINGGQTCPADLALKIEAATDGAISAAVLSPIIGAARRPEQAA